MIDIDKEIENLGKRIEHIEKIVNRLVTRTVDGLKEMNETDIEYQRTRLLVNIHEMKAIIQLLYSEKELLALKLFNYNTIMDYTIKLEEEEEED